MGVSISIKCRYQKSQWHNSTFHIVVVRGPAVLGLTAWEKLKLGALHCSENSRRRNSAYKTLPMKSVDDLVNLYLRRFDKNWLYAREYKDPLLTITCSHTRWFTQRSTNCTKRCDKKGAWHHGRKGNYSKGNRNDRLGIKLSIRKIEV